MSNIKPIETTYNGYRFRSRLEARWAVFFDTIGLRYKYESEGLKMSGDVCYLPDFWLPDWKKYVEIKPDLPYEFCLEDDQIILAFDKNGATALGKFIIASAELTETKEGITTNGILMLCGTPGVPKVVARKGRWELRDGSVSLSFLKALGAFEISAFSDSLQETEMLDIWPLYLEGSVSNCVTGKLLTNPIFPRGSVARMYIGNGRTFDSSRLVRAYTAARSARFEHGETPK